jgi:microcystin-dependent protein
MHDLPRHEQGAAEMAEPFLGEIRTFAFDFAPKGWAKCEGQLMPINQNQALFALLGTTYGGDGRVTFALPDLRGRVTVSASSTHPQGEAGGEESHALTLAELPAHTHRAKANASNGNSNSPTENVWAANPNAYRASGSANMDPNAIAGAGGNQPHNTMQPYLAMNTCIALTGVFPARS